MKYPNIQTLVPAGEDFDESAIMNEGAWVSTGHLKKIDNALTSVAAKDARIKVLEAQLASQNSTTSRSATTSHNANVNTGNRANATTGNIASTSNHHRYDSAEHPMNKDADQFLSAKRVEKKEKEMVF